MCLVLWRLDAPEKGEVGRGGDGGVASLEAKGRGIGTFMEGRPGRGAFEM